MISKKRSKIGLVSFFTSLGGLVQLIFCVLLASIVQARGIMSGGVDMETGVFLVFTVIGSVVLWLTCSAIGFVSGVIGMVKKDKSRGLLIGGVILSMLAAPVLLFFGILSTALGR